jgi:hypothetical protein
VVWSLTTTQQPGSRKVWLEAALKTNTVNQRGGKRPGAGRPKGSATKRTREIADAAMAEGLTPLEYMLEVMRDVRADEARRLDAAKSAAPYVHPRLSSVEAQINGEVGLKVEIVRFGDNPPTA